MSLSDEPDFIRNCPVPARNALEPLIREFSHALRQNANPTIEGFLSRAPQENQDYLLHELLFEEKEARGGVYPEPTIQWYRERFAKFPQVLQAIFGVTSSSDQLWPEHVGRYKIIRKIGEGGFGAVYLAQDTQLKRPVALKVPRSDRFVSAEERERFLNEARTIAQLGTHANIVTLFDVLEQNDKVFIVQEYVQGEDLRHRLQRHPGGLDPITSVGIVIKVAQAMAFAHEKGFYHRDIKPENILLDGQGNPKVADFGLAIHEDHRASKRGDRSGTIDYMSPERIRGETHRIDGRSDLWSLGVVLYELLTGRRPFQGTTPKECAEEIRDRDPVPLRQWRPVVSAELERICAMCLAKPKSERYPTAHDLIEELQSWLRADQQKTSDTLSLVTPPNNTISGKTAIPHSSDIPRSLSPTATPTSDSGKNAIEGLVPKGLRAFDIEDQDVFLDLLPGPRGRDGLPHSLRFWKKRVDGQSVVDPMAVGVLYGPSGSGKTSLIKAGLLPRLASTTQVIYLDSYDQAAEQALCDGIFRIAGKKSLAIPLPELASQVRSGKLIPRGIKLLLVLDQFEQWFSIDTADKNRWTDMLRHCDGQRLSTLLMIRDDFWMQTTRLMREIEVPMVEGVNAGSLDLFSLNHAENVLRWMGFAYGCLPQNYGEGLTKEHKEFLKQAIERISDHGKVIPVKLTVFVEMMRERTWIPSTLEKVGGFEGLGVFFLDELFNSKHASADTRYHQEGAKRILSSLVPKGVSSVRDAIQSLPQLKEISDYTSRPEEEFQSLLKLLDRKLRLITPVETMGSISDVEQQGHVEGEPTKSIIGYKLAHDYLIPSIREWLALKQKRTPRGRAELVLGERADAWSQRKENQQLPTILEWLSIRIWTRPSRWSKTEAELMRHSDHVHFSRLAASAGVLATGIALAWWASNASERNQQLRIDAIQSMELSSWSGKQDLIPRNSSNRLIERLKERWRLMPKKSDERLKLALAMLPHDDSILDEILENLDSATSSRAQAIYRGVGNYKTQVSEYCESVLSKGTPGSSLGIAAALAQFASESERWADLEYVNKVVNGLLDAEAFELTRWLDHFEPVKKRLLPRFSELLLDHSPPLGQSRDTKALEVIERYADSQDYLQNLLIQGPPAAFEKIFAKYRALGDEQAIAMMRSEIQKSDEESDDERRANAALGLLLLGQELDVRQFLTVSDDPDRLTHFIFQAKGRSIPGEVLIRLIEQERSTVKAENLRQCYLRIYGLLLALGQCDVNQISPAVRSEFENRLSEMYREHPSRSVHSAAGWLMRQRQWKLNQEVESVDSTPKEYDASGMREWYVVKVPTDREDHAAQYLTMLVFSADDLHPKISRDLEPKHMFAMCDREVTLGLYNEMLHQEAQEQVARQRTYPGAGTENRLYPVNMVSWLDAVDFSEWLTQTTRMHADSRFRLPSGSEWSLAATAGMVTEYGFGKSERFLSEFEWYHENAKAPQMTAILPPTPSGLFDIHGNLSEWIQDVTIENQGSKQRFCEFRGTNYDQYANLGKVTYRSSKMLRNKTEPYSNIGIRLAQSIHTNRANKESVENKN